LAIGDRGSLNEDGSFVIPGFRTRFGENAASLPEKTGEKRGASHFFILF